MTELIDFEKSFKMWQQFLRRGLLSSIIEEARSRREFLSEDQIVERAKEIIKEQIQQGIEQGLYEIRDNKICQRY